MQQNKLYVGNFPYSVDEEQLRSLFSPYGEIEELALIMVFEICINSHCT